MKIDKDLVTFITGAASGFGFEISQDLLDLGCKCYLTDREVFPSEFLSKYPKDRLITRVLDVKDEQGIKEAIEDCAKQFGHIDVVINSAGIGTPSLPVLEPASNANWMKHCLDVNVVGTFNVCKYSALQLVKQQNQNKEKKDYLIINFGSSAATNAYYGMSIYGASKGAVLGMTLPMARDLGKYNIRVVCMCPGFFNTRILSNAPKGFLDIIAKGTALGRHGEPSEMSLALQGVITSTFINGTHFFMDSSHAAPNL